MLTLPSKGWEKLPRSSSNLSVGALADLATFAEDWPEIEYIAPGGYFGYSTNYQKNNPTDAYNYATIVSGMVAPLSRGTIDIASNDTSDPPIINPNWLTHPTDKAVAIAAFKRTREIWESEAMREITIGEEYFPGKAQVSTDDEIWEFIQQSFSTIFHAACTCKMGRSDDPNTVVDTKARVIGVKGLRVVDASALPLLPPGHPMATICKSFLIASGRDILSDGRDIDALAEKVAEDILNGR
jgi:choline dehydrogenase